MKSILFIVIGVVLLGGIFLVVRSEQNTSSPISSSNQIQRTTPTIEKTHPQNSSFTLRIANKKLIASPSTITVQKNQMVIIHIKSDEEDELHLHGYDKSVELSKDDLATLAFKADTAGRFPFELENAKAELGVLEVQP